MWVTRRMSDAPEIRDAWEFYVCRVEDAPASILLNLGFEEHAPLGEADTLYVVRIALSDPGEHGMGGAAEAELLRPIEDRITEGAQATGLYYVGRVRSEGVWQLTFYGRAGWIDALRPTHTTTELLAGRRLEVRTMPDPDWGYYREFLLPDAERRRWIEDRHVVEALQERGDTLALARQVHHWTFFTSASARAGFVADAEREGFVVDELVDTADGARAFGAQLGRVDAVELDHIHDVVMGLVELAERHDGDYDGWETSVEWTAAEPPS